MRKLIRLLTLFAIGSLLNTLNAQTDKVRISIPGKHDLIYDGLRLVIEAPNLSIGKGAGINLSSGMANTLLGQDAGTKLENGSSNTFIGFQSGANNSGAGNVFLGHQAGANAQGSNKLYISNSSSDFPLIFGDFTSKTLTINDNLIVEKDLTLPDLNTGSNSNLTIDDMGKVVTKPIKVEKYNKYSFVIDESNAPSFRKATLGVNLSDGAILSGIRTTALDNDNDTGSATNTIYLSLRRVSRFNAVAPQIIYSITGLLTPDDTFTNRFTGSVLSGCTNCNIVDNVNYIYYFEVVYCDDCDFREVSIVE